MNAVNKDQLNIVVCIKAVPSTTEVKMDPKTNTIVRDGKQAVVNPFDASALEVALRIKDERTASCFRTARSPEPTPWPRRMP